MGSALHVVARSTTAYIISHIISWQKENQAFVFLALDFRLGPPLAAGVFGFGGLAFGEA
jgi:hypothetical protein